VFIVGYWIICIIWTRRSCMLHVITMSRGYHAEYHHSTSFVLFVQQKDVNVKGCENVWTHQGSNKAQNLIWMLGVAPWVILYYVLTDIWIKWFLIGNHKYLTMSNTGAMPQFPILVDTCPIHWFNIIMFAIHKLRCIKVPDLNLLPLDEYLQILLV
jgi:hypothetical protein